MQSTFYCPWCQKRKPLATGYKQIDRRRRKCQQCVANTLGATVLPSASAPASPQHRSTP